MYVAQFVKKSNCREREERSPRRDGLRDALAFYFALHVTQLLELSVQLTVPSLAICNKRKNTSMVSQFRQGILYFRSVAGKKIIKQPKEYN